MTSLDCGPMLLILQRLKTATQKNLSLTENGQYNGYKVSKVSDSEETYLFDFSKNLLDPRHIMKQANAYNLRFSVH